MQSRELSIRLLDGGIRRVPLQGQRVSLGRSSENDLAYPDDSVLSRRHMVFDFDGLDWWVEDLNSTNGTSVNELRLQGRQRLQLGDTVTAGRITLVYGMPSGPDPGVVFVSETERPIRPGQGFQLDSPGTGAQTIEAVQKSPAITGSSRVQALLDAGRLISSDRPLDDLFRVILDLVLGAVGGSRGVIMVDEAGQLVPKAMRGTGFRISQAVRDRVIKDKESVLVLDASRHEVLSSSTTIQRQRVRSLMAVPLQTQDRVMGLIYVDSQDEVHFFLHEDLTLMTLMANMAAIRIEQAQQQQPRS
ncbi:MAG: FHA domain-containing protein [Acidobacteria bacterium]|nr:FHA domain-containing protein [Acidobacteriota bacterium]